MKTFFWMILFLGPYFLCWGQPSRAQKVLDMENRLQKLEETLSRLRGGKPPQQAPTPPPLPVTPPSVPNTESSADLLPSIDTSDILKEPVAAPTFSPPPNRIEPSQRNDLSQSPYPLVEELAGEVSRYQQDSQSFIPVLPGYEIKKPILLVVAADSELILSFPGRVAARVSENSRLVVGPAVDGRYEVDLRSGTLSALLDPDRDLSQDPSFAVRTLSGVTEAVGTYYAVTEYKGQSYTSVKKGKVQKKTTPPTKPDFSAYLKKKKPTASSKN
jgi:hypothetical protein